MKVIDMMLASIALLKGRELTDFEIEHAKKALEGDAGAIERAILHAVERYVGQRR